MSASLTTPSPPRNDRPRAAVAVLDYAPAPESFPKASRRWFREMGPWVVWPSRRSWVFLALLVGAAVWLSWLPRNCEVVAAFEARDDGPVVLGATNRVFYRAADHSLRIRDLSIDAGGAAEVQLEPSATHTEPLPSADGTRVVGFSESDLVFWETRAGKMLGRLPLAKLTHLGGAPDDWGDVNISPDATRLVVRYGKGRMVMWDVSNIAQPRVAATRGPDKLMEYERPIFSGDGRHLLVARGDTVWLGDAETLEGRLTLTYSPQTEVRAWWSADGLRLIVCLRTADAKGEDLSAYQHVEPAPARRQNEQFYRLHVIDPDHPTRPLGRLAYWNPYTLSADISRDGQKLVVHEEAIYEMKTWQRHEWPVERTRLHAMLGDDRPEIVRMAYGSFIHVVDGPSGRVTARVPFVWHPPIVLADGQTLLSQDADGLVRARRLDPQRRAEPSAWWSWRLWLMAPFALLLSRSLWRDAVRRRRRGTAVVNALDARAAGAMVAIGVAALAAGLAFTAIDWNFLADVWWSGHWVGWCVVPLIACGVGVAAGSRIWMWATRALLACFAVVATVNACGYYGDEPPYLLLDVTWSPPLWLQHATCAAFAVASAAGTLYLGRRQAVRAA